MAGRRESIIVGMGGWDLPPFEQFFYPPHPEKGFRKLEYYSRFFNGVEVNATFYNTSLTPDHARRWLQDVSANPDFIFTVKLFQGFTHTFEATNEDVRAVHHLLEPLAAAGRLGGLLVQFPYHFTNLPERRHYVAHLARVFRPYRIFVEVRHASWNTPAVREGFRDCGIVPVNVDLPRIRQHMPFTAYTGNDAVYFRMMGRNGFAWCHPDQEDRYSYLYSAEELERLAVLIEQVRGTARSVFVVFHNDPEANSLVNGFQLQRRLGGERRKNRAPASVAAERKETRLPLFRALRAGSMELPLFAQSGIPA